MRLLLVDVPGDPDPWDFSDPETCVATIPPEYRAEVLALLTVTAHRVAGAVIATADRGVRDLVAPEHRDVLGQSLLPVGAGVAGEQQDDKEKHSQ